MKRSRVVMFCVAVATLASASALAGRIYLNGVPIDGVTNQKFEKCTVTIDANGDVHINAPGYLVEGAGKHVSKPKETPSTTVTGLPSRRYWMVKEEHLPGKAQYDIDIYINSVWFKRIRSNGEQVVQEITKYLRAGRNVIHFAATKNVGQKRKSFSPGDYMQIIIGEGDIGGNNVMIETPLIQYKRTANETANFNDEYTITVQ
ncbi:MAG: hypothetical protein JXR96_23415 [Deltaproteobacteria bacterium]|nr:hypothetical protein [Deltaproteobacteria bacterium]